MGAINNAFTQAAGAVAGAALAIKNTKEVEASKLRTVENAALVARNQSREADAATYDAQEEVERPGGLEEQGKEAEEKVKKAEKRAAQAKAMNEAYPSPMNKGKAKKRAKELEAAKKALEFLTNSVEAKKDIVKRSIEQRLHANELTDIASKEREKYESRWGGIE
jgi:hypothetical protein